MKCPHCQSTSYRKNGHRGGKQNYLCKNCGRQFIESASSVVLAGESIHSPADSSNKRVETSIAEETPSPLGEEPQQLVLNQTDFDGSKAGELLSRGAGEKEKTDEYTHHNSLGELLVSEAKIESSVSPASESGVSVLLLDAENLKFDVNAEKFIVGLSEYPQLIKIAFANWRNSAVGKQDAELYERGYQLLHVPNGKNSADAKMIAFGASIFKPYPKVKEVFICSSDGLLIHLCNQLLVHGITVYLVKRKDENLILENRQTGESKHYSIPLSTEIPSVEVLMRIMQDLIESEQQSINERVNKLSCLTALFQARYNIIKQTSIITSEPDKNDFVNGEKALEQLVEHTLDELKAASEDHSKKPEEKKLDAIDSKEKLEKAIIEIIQTMKSNLSGGEISTNTLTKEFTSLYGTPPSSVIKELGLGRTLSKFLKSCASFKVEQKGNQYKIELTQSVTKNKK